MRRLCGVLRILCLALVLVGTQAWVARRYTGRFAHRPCSSLSSLARKSSGDVYPKEFKETMDLVDKRYIPMKVDPIEYQAALDKAGMYRQDNFWQHCYDKFKANREENIAIYNAKKQAATKSKTPFVYTPADVKEVDFELEKIEDLANLNFIRRYRILFGGDRKDPASIVREAIDECIDEFGWDCSDEADEKEIDRQNAEFGITSLTDSMGQAPLGGADGETAGEEGEEGEAEESIMSQILSPVQRFFADGSGWSRIVYFLKSLRTTPTWVDIGRNAVLGASIATGIMIAPNVNLSENLFVLGILFFTTTLLSRGLKSVRDTRTGEFAALSTFSTLVGVGMSFSVALVSWLVLRVGVFAWISVLTREQKARLALCGATLVTAFVTSLFEVYEKKKNARQRWYKAMAQYVQERGGKRAGSGTVKEITDDELYDYYDYAYDPDRDDLTPQEERERVRKRLAGEEVSMSVNQLEQQREEQDLAQPAYHRFLQLEEELRNGSWAAAPTTIDPVWAGFKPEAVSEPTNPWVKKAIERHVFTREQREAEEERLREIREKNLRKGKIRGEKMYREGMPDWLKNTPFGDKLKGEGEAEDDPASVFGKDYGVYRQAMWKIKDDIVLDPADYPKNPDEQVKRIMEEREKRK